MFNLFKRRELKTIDKNSISELIKNYTDIGISGEKNGVIVSLTSFPPRIDEVEYTIYSLLNQTYKPAKIILWLSYEEFPNRENDLPQSLLNLRKNGLTIGWTNNTCSYKKLIPALKEYPNNPIVTCDDDIYYDSDWLEKLVNEYKTNSECIVCHRAHKVKFQRDKFAPYKRWPKKIKSKKPSFYNFMTGIGGVLYPPDSLYKDVLNENLFMQLAPKADDIWFWAMALLNNTKIHVVQNGIREFAHINPERERGLTDGFTLFAYNKKGGNDIQLNNIFKHYPEISKRLI